MILPKPSAEVEIFSDDPAWQEAKTQTLEILDGGLIYAKGPNSVTDTEEVPGRGPAREGKDHRIQAGSRPPPQDDQGRTSLFRQRKLRAHRHPVHPLRNSAVDELVPLKIQSAQPPEQGPSRSRGWTKEIKWARSGHG